MSNRLIQNVLMALSLFVLNVSDVHADDEFLAEEALPKDAVPVAMITYAFDEDVLGKSPEHFESVTLESGSTVQWLVKPVPGAPSAPNGLTQIGQVAGKTTALLLVKESVRDQGEVAVRFRTLSTDDEQLSGIVFRYKDPQNYFLFTTSTREDACHIYHIKDGKRKKMATSATLMAPFKWHEARLVFSEKTYTALINSEAVIGKKTKPSPGGRVGIFIAGNSHVVFDNFQISK